MIKLDVPEDVKLGFERARVMAGSSLTPASRIAQDAAGYTRQFTDDCVDDHQQQRIEAAGEDAGRERSDAEAQMGRVLTGVQVEQKLKKLNPSLLFEDCKAFPERRVIYIPDREEESGRRMVAAMEHGPMPEFSIMDLPKEKWLEPHETKRGWRTVLGHCIRLRVVGPEAVIREFGIPTHDSALWAKMTR